MTKAKQGSNLTTKQEMKAELNAGGKLIIEAENELESYALRKWHKDNPINYENIIVGWSSNAYLQKPEFPKDKKTDRWY